MSTQLPNKITQGQLTEIVGQLTGKHSLSRGSFRDSRVNKVLEGAEMKGGGNVKKFLSQKRGESISRGQALKVISAVEKAMTPQQRRRLGATNVRAFNKSRADGAKGILRGAAASFKGDKKALDKQKLEEAQAKKQAIAKKGLIESEKGGRREKAEKRLEDSGVITRKKGPEGILFRRQRLGIGGQDNIRNRLTAKKGRQGALEKLENIRGTKENKDGVVVQERHSSAIEKKEDPWTASNPKDTQRSTGASLDEGEQNKKTSQSGSVSNSAGFNKKTDKKDLSLPF